MSERNDLNVTQRPGEPEVRWSFSGSERYRCDVANSTAGSEDVRLHFGVRQQATDGAGISVRLARAFSMRPLAARALRDMLRDIIADIDADRERR